MRKLGLIGLLVIWLLVAVHFSSSAQDPKEVVVRLNTNQIVYSGPGTNGAYMEYVAAGREVMVGGRNSSTTWLEINVDGQVVGWVPVASISVVRGELLALAIKGGLLDLGAGAYDVDNPSLRAAEIEMIRIQRPMRFIGARWFRLQAFMGASCLSLPPIPPPPSVRVSLPELERVQRELVFVQEQTVLAIQLYQELCDAGGQVDESRYNRGVNHLNQAYNTFDVVRKYMNELAGLEYVVY